MSPLKEKEFFCSWSGGKDSCLALYLAIQEGGLPRALLTMLEEEGARSRSHHLPLPVVQQQAHALGIPLAACKTSWEDYEADFTKAIGSFRAEGIAHGVFGDIDIEDHMRWVERVCSAAGIQAHEPLWKQPRQTLLETFLDLGFTAVIIAVKEDVLDRSFLGRALDHEMIAAMEEAGIDPSGEEGEYHTVVISGPIFTRQIPIRHGSAITQGGYCFLDISLASAS